MLKYLLFTTIVVSLALFSVSCTNSLGNEEQYETPDTSNLLKLANFLSKTEVMNIIADSSVLKNGKKRFKGIAAIPQNGDDFRNADLDEVYWKSTSVIEGDFRGASFRSANCNGSDFSYSDFTGGGLEGASFVNSRLLACNFQGAHLQGVDFTGADLKDCYFFGAEFENTIFKDAINIPKIIQKMIVDNRITGLCDER